MQTSLIDDLFVFLIIMIIITADSVLFDQAIELPAEIQYNDIKVKSQKPFMFAR